MDREEDLGIPPSDLFPPGTKIGSYEIGNWLALPTANSFVFHAKSETTPGKFAFKYIRPTVKPEFIQSEIEMNMSLTHCPNAVVGFDFVQVDDSYGYFMDRYTRGDLLDFVLCNALTEDNVRNMSHRILVAIAYMHSAGFVHRDIKLENILLDGEGSEPRTYLADFGLSAKKEVGRMFTDSVGTRQYCAPELFAHQPYDESVDMWAFGVTLYAMFTGAMPFPDPESEWPSFISDVRNGNYIDDPLFGLSDDACDLIGGLLKPSPEDRLTAEQALRHPFYQSLASQSAVDGVKQQVQDINEFMPGGSEAEGPSWNMGS